MTQSRPFAVTLLALLAGLQALIAAYHTLQFLHILPFYLGDMKFYSLDWLAAILWGVSALCYLWAARSLWAMEEQGWMFMTILSGWIVILDVIELFGATPFSAVAPSLVVSAVVLIYCLWPGTRDKFDNGRSRSTLSGPGVVA